MYKKTTAEMRTQVIRLDGLAADADGDSIATSRQVSVALDSVAEQKPSDGITQRWV